MFVSSIEQAYVMLKLVTVLQLGGARRVQMFKVVIDFWLLEVMEFLSSCYGFQKKKKKKKTLCLKLIS